MSPTNEFINSNEPKPTFAPDMPMKWYYFIIYIQLFSAALISFGNALQHFTGLVQGDHETARIIYDLFPSIKVLDISYGILYILFTIYALYVRNLLAHYRTAGPVQYLCFIIFPNLFTPLYAFLASLLTPLPMDQLIDASTVGSNIGISISFFIVNSIYFKKRKHLFNK